MLNNGRQWDQPIISGTGKLNAECEAQQRFAIGIATTERLTSSVEKLMYSHNELRHHKKLVPALFSLIPSKSYIP